MTTTFPDKKYLANLARQTRKRVQNYQNLTEQLLTDCGAALNWIADYITDKNIKWSKVKLPINKLYLTGTNPKWNKIIIEKCHRSPVKLEKLITTDKGARALFTKAKFSSVPILVRFDAGQYKVLDGMKRVIAAIRDNRETIIAFVAKLHGRPRPQCEPHVIYDLLRAYQRGNNQDRKGLIMALKFLKKSYANIGELLSTRFGGAWLGDKKIQGIIREVLKN